MKISNFEKKCSVVIPKIVCLFSICLLLFSIFAIFIIQNRLNNSVEKANFITLLICTIFFLMCAIGLIKYKNWARIFLVLSSCCGIVLNVFFVIYYLKYKKNDFDLSGSYEILLYIGIIIISIFYLWIMKIFTSNEIKSKFKKLSR